MLEVNVVTRTSGRSTVLSRISLTVHSGERVSILGPTGSGKTSLLRLIMGLDLMDRGDIRFEQQFLARPGENLVPPEQRGFSLVFEQTVLLPSLNVEENILIGSQPADESAQQRLEEILTLLSLNDLRGRSSLNLSGGERQRIALARSLFVQPRLLLLDEPFHNIDRPSRDRLIPGLKEYLEHRGTTVILVTHDRDQAFCFSQRIFLLRDGELIRADTPEQLYRHPAGDWDARLLGDCNLLPADVAARVLGYKPSRDDVKWILVRPEHLEVCSDPPHNATLQEVRFLGFYRTLAFQIQHDELVLVKVITDEEYVAGRLYQLRLKSEAAAEELTSRSEPKAKEQP
jgi:ABC-type Fe3+/spermidine/putrescine transport system ATPase subunit